MPRRTFDYLSVFFFFFFYFYIFFFKVKTLTQKSRVDPKFFQRKKYALPLEKQVECALPLEKQVEWKNVRDICFCSCKCSHTTNTPTNI